MKLEVVCKEIVRFSQRSLWLQQWQTQAFLNIVMEQRCGCGCLLEEVGSGGSVRKSKAERNIARQRKILRTLFQWQWTR